MAFGVTCGIPGNRCAPYLPGYVHIHTGLTNALKLVHKKLPEVRIVLNGAGAAASARALAAPVNETFVAHHHKENP